MSSKPNFISYVVSAGNKIAKTRDEALARFETPLGKSYLCPSPPVINMYDGDGNAAVVLRLTNMQIQPFEIERAKFSTGKS